MAKKNGEKKDEITRKKIKIKWRKKIHRKKDENYFSFVEFLVRK